MQDLIWNSRELSPSDYIPIVDIIERMPYTVVRQAEFLQIELIKKHLIADLWYKKFNLKQTLSSEDEAFVQQVGDELYGSESLFDYFELQTLDFTEV